MLEEIGLPTRLLQPLVEPGTTIGIAPGDASRRRAAARRSIAPACHDTASAVASVSASGERRVSQLGHLVAARHRNRRSPSSPPRALRAQLHQRGRRRRHHPSAEEHRRALAAAVLPAALGARRATTTPTTTLLAGARDERLAFRSLIDPDYRVVPATRPTCRRRSPAYCRQTGQPEPGDAGRVRARDSRKPRVQVSCGARVARGADRHAASTRSASSAAGRATAC